ncbi:SDR family NAD(P)-dependent oxidoreductase [Kordiimonas laminariae]|uniref:SDR family NAD(P)-dependent oxidoreductase n=1 Tax=Kordiimonas laminariae TaxID=2917717 RepID=UPI001FF1DD02|nr:SDR family NAD(P)-dependent oxidoreductase [Kordiimonas laminariae]MCK0069427.1 SDR family NAD(P)-dependent oxidoreductase [Kordiimonas laminariae]
MKNLKKTYEGWALVTGASSGIGEEFARELAKQKFDLILVARNQAALERLSKELVSEYQINTRVVAMDLVQVGAAQALYNSVNDLNVSLLIASAGIDEMGPFLEKDYADLGRMLKLNVDVPSELAHLFGKNMAANNTHGNKRSGIILVSSLFAYQGIPNFAAYAATKAYILTLGEALTAEMKSSGIDVLTLSPGLTSTPFAAGLKLNAALLPMIPQRPETVARTGLRNLGRKMSVVSGLLNKLYAWENRLIPRSWPVHLFGFLIGNAMKSYERRQAKLNTESKTNT